MLCWNTENICQTTLMTNELTLKSVWTRCCWHLTRPVVSLPGVFHHLGVIHPTNINLIVTVHPLHTSFPSTPLPIMQHQSHLRKRRNNPPSRRQMFCINSAWIISSVACFRIFLDSLLGFQSNSTWNLACTMILINSNNQPMPQALKHWWYRSY